MELNELEEVFNKCEKYLAIPLGDPLSKDYQTLAGLCQGLGSRGPVFKLMSELYRGESESSWHYFPTNDGQHVRHIAMLLLEQFIISEELYKEWR